MFDKILESPLASKKRSTASIQIGRTRADAVPMATVERNVYDEKTMSVLVTGEPGTDEAETFLQDKLCEQGLKVIEVYSEWAGRCLSVLPLMKRLKLEKDYEQACFVMLHCCAESHPLLEEFRGKSMPHFLFFRNGVRKALVLGANMPAIEKYVIDYTPFGPETDDLEENPQLKRRREERAESAARAAETLAN